MLTRWMLAAAGNATTSAPAVYRVRETDGSTEQDFTLAQVTGGSLATFVGANNGGLRTWYDISGNNKHATQTTAGFQPLVATSGVVETGVKFNGSSSYLSADGVLVSTDIFAAYAAITFAAWVNPSSGQCLWMSHRSSSNAGFILSTNTDKLVIFTILSSGNTVITSTSSVPYNQWTHVATTWNFSTGVVKLFINGVQDATSQTVSTSGISLASSMTLLGAQNTGTGVTSYATGSMSDARIYTSDRSSDIAGIHAGSYIGTPAMRLAANYP